MFSNCAFQILALLPCAVTVVLAHPKSYAAWAADSGMARGQGNGLDATGNPLVSYEHGEFQWGLRLLYERTGNKKYYDYIQKGVDNVVSDNGTIGGGYKCVMFRCCSEPSAQANAFQSLRLLSRSCAHWAHVLVSVSDCRGSIPFPADRQFKDTKKPNCRSTKRQRMYIVHSWMPTRELLRASSGINSVIPTKVELVLCRRSPAHTSDHRVA